MAKDVHAPRQSSSEEIRRLLAANERLQKELAQHERAAQVLRKREQEARSIIDNIPAGLALLTPEGEIEVVNRQLLDYFGRTFEELRGWMSGEAIHSEDRSRAIERFRHSIASGTRLDNEQRQLRFDGVFRWFRVLGVPLHDVDGSVTRWCVLHIDIEERKRAEAALRESERESRLIVDTIPGLVATLTPAGEVEVVNLQVVEYCGQPLEAMKEWGTNGTVHAEDLPRVVQVFTQAITAGEPYDFEARLRRFDGVYRWFQVRGLPLRDPGEHIVRWYVLLTDIDDRVRAEDALRASERNLRLTIDTIPGLVWRGTPEGELDYLNQRAVEYLGHTAESLSGGRWLGLIHPDQRDTALQRWLHSATTGSSYQDEYRLRRADGQYRWIQSVGEPFHDTKGRIANWYGLVIDIEDRKQAEVELRTAHGRLAEAQRLSKTGSFVTDLAADVHDWSEEALRIFEFDPARKVTLQDIREVIHPEDMPLFEAAYRAAIEGLDVNLAYRINTSKGNVKHIQAVAHVMDNEDKRPLFIGAIQDVTERERAAEALSRARSDLAHVSRVTTLGTLTASVAHEINQPLSGIMTNAGTCLRMLDADPPDVNGARETARRTIRDANRVSDVIARLRMLFSKREFTLERLDLNEAAREVVALSLRDLQRNRVVLESELAEDLPIITGDRIQLQQVILNLLRNASDAMTDVTDRPRQLLIKTEREAADRVRLTVRDAGVGVDGETMDKLFSPFYTTKPGGMGIGLSVSRSIVERHHGRLWVEPNEHGPGSAFSFSIPCPAATEVNEAPQ